MRSALCVLQVPGDRTLVVATGRVPAAVAKVDRSDGWRCITLDVDVPLDQPGFLRIFADALADANVPIYPLAGFRTDHFLVREADRERALDVLVRVCGMVPAGV